jgi:hypothetical protein
LSSFCVNSWALSRKIFVLATSSRITYALWNVNSIRWWCWNIATDDRKLTIGKVKPLRQS